MEAGFSRPLVRQPAFPVSDHHASSAHSLQVHPLHHVQSVPVITSLETPLLYQHAIPSVAGMHGSVISPVQSRYENSSMSSGVWQSRRHCRSQLGWLSQTTATPSSHVLQPATSATVLDIDPRLLLDRPANPPPQLTDSCIHPVVSMQPVSFIHPNSSLIFQSPYCLADSHMVRNSAFQPRNFSHM